MKKNVHLSSLEQTESFTTVIEEGLAFGFF